jgi:hypothetical protein
MKDFTIVYIVFTLLITGCAKKEEIEFDNDLFDSIFLLEPSRHVIELSDTTLFGQMAIERLGDTLVEDFRIGRGLILNSYISSRRFDTLDMIQTRIMAYRDNDTIFFLIYGIVGPGLVKTIITNDKYLEAYMVFQSYHNPSPYDETYKSGTYLIVDMEKSVLKIKNKKLSIGDTIMGYIDYMSKEYTEYFTKRRLGYNGFFKTVILSKGTFDGIEPYSIFRMEENYPDSTP